MSHGYQRILRGAAAAVLGAGIFALLPASPASASHEAARNIDDACPPGQVPDAGFADDLEGDDDDTTENTAENTQRAIDCIVAYDVASGQNTEPPTYNPTGNVSRGQMATFLMQKLDLVEGFTRPADADDAFTDDDNSVHQDNIDDAFATDVANGVADPDDQCNDTAGAASPNTPDGQTPDFCPSKDVTRAQMASFVVNQLRAAGADIPTPTDPEPFDDVDCDGLPADEPDDNVHCDNIAIVHELGIFVGGADGNYNPGAPISRAQMALVLARDLDYLVEQGLVDPLAGAANEGQVVDCDGDEITFVNGADEVVTIDTDDLDTFTVDGTAVSEGVFQAACDPGDEISVTDDSAALTNVENVDDGMVGNVDLASDTFDVINEVTGDTVDTVDYSGAGVTFTVNGAAASLTSFEASLSEGDTVSVNRNDNGVITSIDLTNGSITGAATDVDNVTGTFQIENAFGDEPENANDEEFLADATDEFTVDGEEATLAEFLDDLNDGDTITYSRVGGVETYALENEPPPAIEGLASFIEDDFDPATNTFNVVTSRNSEENCTYSSDATFIVDGTVVTEAEFENNLSSGDEVSCQAGDEDTDTEETVILENGPLTGAISEIDTAGDSYRVGFPGITNEDEFEIADVDYTASYFGGPDRYFVNDTEVDLATFEEFLDDIDAETAANDGELDPDDVITVVDGALATEHRLETDNEIPA